MCNFRVGQKVVLIDDQWRASHMVAVSMGVSLPLQGNVYTVREVVTIPGMPSPAIRLTEIVNPIIRYNIGLYEAAFGVQRFRPVVERKTDISIFRAMLNNAPEKVGAV